MEHTFYFIFDFGPIHYPLSFILVISVNSFLMALVLGLNMVKIDQWVYKDWSIIFSHTLDEGNSYTNWRANWSLSKDQGLHWLDSPPYGLSSLLYSDLIGVFMSWVVCV